MRLGEFLDSTAKKCAGNGDPPLVRLALAVLSGVAQYDPVNVKVVRVTVLARRCLPLELEPLWS